ncbi:MAG: hypothetical protein ACMUJM_07525 [bacterium]
MKRMHWQIILGLSMILLSIVVYVFHYIIFRDAHHIFIYLIGDIAFVFIEVLLVTLIIHRVLEEREKRARLEKMNMVIGAFFSQVGTWLLTFISHHDKHIEAIRKELVLTDNWSKHRFAKANKRLGAYPYEVEIEKVPLDTLRTFLKGENNFLLRLLENPNLLEHETFTELLRAVFHLTEELLARNELTRLPPADTQHLAGDIHRAYNLLVHQWLKYAEYLKNNYPYLFSLIMRTNPFDEHSSPVVT